MTSLMPTKPLLTLRVNHTGSTSKGIVEGIIIGVNHVLKKVVGLPLASYINIFGAPKKKIVLAQSNVTVI
jgi:hypothetical protein